MNDEISSLETAVAEAEGNVVEAEAAVTTLQEKISDMQTQLNQAQETLTSCQNREELSKETAIQAKQELEQYSLTQQAHLVEIDSLVKDAESKLNHAQEALDKYLSVNPPAAAFSQWVHWQPQNGQLITPQIIHDRLTISPEQQKQFSDYLYHRDTGYRTLVNDYRTRYSTANGSAEKIGILNQAHKGLCGSFAEKMVVHALGSIGTPSTQDRTYFKDNTYTKTDLSIQNLKSPVVLGKGDRMGSAKGGSLAFEIKTGHTSYLYSQMSHMVFQAGGHQKASASMTLCSRDFNNLPMDKQQELRDSLRNAGSPLFAILPSKDELDSVINQTICQPKGTK